ncbi:MAG: ParA family protein [Legionellales bacterium]|jgi:chromosome partitioning protein|nr:ParA family protein [Legionellales bacterium]
MCEIIAITNQKGGVGKTTSAINLATSLAATRRRILLVDFDPQGNASTGSGISLKTDDITTKEVLLGENNITEAIFKTEAKFDIIASDRRLTVAEVKLLQLQNREYLLKQALLEVQSNYDYILIDCPPGLNELAVNALTAASSVLVPVQCEYYALEGLASLVATIDQLRKTANPGLSIAGVLRTMFDGRNRLANQVSDQLVAHFGSLVLDTIIPRNVRLAEAPSYGKPALLYDNTSQGAITYLALAGEINAKMSQRLLAVNE